MIDINSNVRTRIILDAEPKWKFSGAVALSFPERCGSHNLPLQWQVAFEESQ
jgi:hypothetical protein